MCRPPAPAQPRSTPPRSGACRRADWSRLPVSGAASHVSNGALYRRTAGVRSGAERSGAQQPAEDAAEDTAAGRSLWSRATRPRRERKVRYPSREENQRGAGVFPTFSAHLVSWDEAPAPFPRGRWLNPADALFSGTAS